MKNIGPKEDVKLGLLNAIRSRRVAQGLEGMPAIEAKRPKIETVGCLTWAYTKCFSHISNFHVLYCGFETIGMIICGFPSLNSHVIQGHVFSRFSCHLKSRKKEELDENETKWQLLNAGSVGRNTCRSYKR